MRKFYLDNIRWVTVVLVVIYHVFYMYNAEGVLGGLGKITHLDVQYYDIYLYIVYPWFMLILFLVSGICSKYYLDHHTGKEFVKSRTRKLLLLTVVVWGAAQILNTPVVIVYRFGLYGIVFFLGYYVFSHDEVIEVLKKYFFLMLVIAVAFGIAFCVLYFGKNYADAPINRSPLFTGFGWFGYLAVLGGAARYGDFENAFTSRMSRHNFGLYVFHYLGISAVALFLGKSGMVSVALVYVLSLLAGFAVGYLLNAVISRIPFFRWAVLGIKKG